jgi:hypothetical protein
MTHHAGGTNSGELGGLVFRGDCRYADKLAYYGDRLENLSLNQPIKASGKLAMRRGVSDSTTLIGFFHAERSMQVSNSQSSGFPMNFLGAAIEGPSSQGFYFYPVYRFVAGADGYARSDDLPRVMPDAKARNWRIEFSPSSSSGDASIVAELDDRKSVLVIPREHLATDVRFNRFGLVTTWIDGNGQHVYFDDLSHTFRQ